MWHGTGGGGEPIIILYEVQFQIHSSKSVWGSAKVWRETKGRNYNGFE
jgi:hypothetical protein